MRESETTTTDGATAASIAGAVQDITYIREPVVHYRGPSLRCEPQIREPALAAALARKIVTCHAREHFLALYLDARHRAIAYQIVSIGCADQSLVHPREVFQPGVHVGAAALVVAHNHPSGDPTPSSEDREVTRRVAAAGKLLGITLLDHIVFTRDGGHRSLRETSPELFRA